MHYKDYTFIFDIDGTLCPVKGEGEAYEELVPYTQMIDKMRYYKENGARIILFTSRNMNTYQGNLGLINKHTAKVLRDWLEQWNIPYDEIIYGKPWAGHKGFYIDDRTIRPDEFIRFPVEQLAEICKDSRCSS